jgi:hypothetical protein
MASEGEDMLVDARDPMEGGSRDVDEPGAAEVIFKDMTIPDGDARRPDGTLKDAREMSWLHSPSDVNKLKRSLPRDEDESSENETDLESIAPPKSKVSTFVEVCLAC